ncbi:hypothetical protein [Streptosporangium subroseum]|nr:hypothetical protein [Streptosporangium subroseum]
MTQVASGNRRLRSYGVASALVLVSACGLAPSAHAAAAAASAHSSPDLPASPGFNLEMTGTSTESVEGPDASFRQFTVNLDMKSRSQESVTIVGIGRSGPGLELLSPGKQDSQVLQPGQSLGFSLKYKIIDCAAVPKGEWPIPVLVEVSGVQTTVYAALRALGSDPEGKRAAEPWQTALSTEVCSGSA